MERNCHHRSETKALELWKQAEREASRNPDGPIAGSGPRVLHSGDIARQGPDFVSHLIVRRFYSASKCKFGEAVQRMGIKPEKLRRALTGSDETLSGLTSSHLDKLMFGG